MRAASIAIRAGCVAVIAGALVAAQPDFGATAPSAPLPIAGPVAAVVSAARTDGPQPTSACQQVAFRVGLHHPGTSQVIVVLTPTAAASTATLQLAEHTANGWSCGAVMTARVGRNGVLPLDQRRSGDGTTPAGVFPLGRMTAWDGAPFSFFGNSPDPGVAAGPYRRVVFGDCFGATPNHPDYGHLVFRPPANCPGPDDEYLPAVTGAYEHAALIGANTEPSVSGDAAGEVPFAAAIFLHRFSLDASGNSKPTAGCVSLSHMNLVYVLRAMRPGVQFAIGETAWLLDAA